MMLCECLGCNTEVSCYPARLVTIRSMALGSLFPESKVNRDLSDMIAITNHRESADNLLFLK